MVVEKFFLIKGIRAYTLTLEKDLLNDWVIRRTWGSRRRPYSQKRTEIFESLEDARIRLETLVNYRIEKRGYESSNKNIEFSRPNYPSKSISNHSNENKKSMNCNESNGKQI